MLGDDAGLLTFPGLYDSFWPYFASFITYQSMIIRPVSGVAHALQYWLFGYAPALYHACNLAVFGLNLVLFYRVIKRFVCARTASLAILFAMSYPLAASTTFAAITINSNLACLFWLISLFCIRERAGYRMPALESALLLLSVLSYEAFAPLFIVNVVLRFKNAEQNKALSLLPVAVAAACFVLYRKILIPASGYYANQPERLSLDSSFWLDYGRAIIEVLRIHSAEVWILLGRLIPVANAIPRLDAIVLALLVLAAIVAAWRMHRTLKANEPLNAPLGKCFALSVSLFLLAAPLIFALSSYQPDSGGYANRVMAAFRWVYALMAASGFMFVYQRLPKLRSVLIVILAVKLCIGFTLTYAQGAAWVEAARFNQKLLVSISETVPPPPKAMEDVDHHYLFAIANPPKFNINREPYFSWQWDATASLQMLWGRYDIRADVFDFHKKMYPTRELVEEVFAESYVQLPLTVIVSDPLTATRVESLDELTVELQRAQTFMKFHPNY